MTKQKITRLKKRNDMNIINNLRSELARVFANFSFIHDEGGGRFSNFSSYTVDSAINRSNELFYICNDDNSIRSFVMVGGDSEWCCETRIEMIAGEISDFKRLIKRAKQYAIEKNACILTFFSYPSQELYNVFEESGFERNIYIEDIETKRVNFLRFQFIFENNKDYVVKKIIC